MIKFLDLEEVNSIYREDVDSRIKTELKDGLKIACQDFLSEKVRSK